MNVLIIGSGFAPAHRKLKEQGHKIFIIPDPHKKRLADIEELYEVVIYIHDVGHIEEYANRICDQKLLFNIDRVISFNEKWQCIAARVASRSGLPIIIEESLVELTIDKYAMRKHLQQTGIASVQFEKVTHYEDLPDAFRRIGFPAILKPLSGEASRNIFLIKDEVSYQQLATTLKKEFNEDYLLESFVAGDEYSIEAVSYNGKHYILAITKKFKNENFIEIGHLLPAPLNAEQTSQIHEYVKSILEALNFNNCPSHTEVILSPSGPVLIESHTRPGGDNIYRLLEFSNGVDLMNIVAKINTNALQDSDLCKKKETEYAAIWYAAQEGNNAFTLEAISHIEEAWNSESIKDITLLTQLGDHARKVTNSFDRSAFAIATGKTSDDALHAAKSALAKISFHYRYHLPLQQVNS
ncbi:ATP-grasp domain-containing protein [Brenneria tiliae]|uniref:ATP-grasp domain-containing protein n=1 Tax=Brenneria tiliae TaxID=2914984 RepID=A0ABT0MVQ1_9GAMM|nr:ATP-grasp domain-containing protein [Brenneria tiliae]MCL2893934.1 ATP-grasp domain-containing protein [Brenneria tiliae]